MHIFRHIFISNYWWQKSDIWSQASYRYPISWEAFLEPSDSYFLFADFVDFYTHWTYMLIFRCIFLSNYWSGADPGFQVRGAHLNKLRRAEGGSKIFRVFRVKNHDFTPTNYIFSNCGGRREIFFGVFRVKNHDFTPKKKSYFFPILGGGHAPYAPPPPLDPPLLMAEIWYLVTSFIKVPHIVGSVFGSIRFLLPVYRFVDFYTHLQM
jgi:hypothetical protein